jgi:hypothetical protein
MEDPTGLCTLDQYVRKATGRSCDRADEREEGSPVASELPDDGLV